MTAAWAREVLSFKTMDKLVNSLQVFPTMGGGWSVKKWGAIRALKRFPTKEAAESWARVRSIKERTVLFIHRRDGTVAAMRSYGNGPHPPRARKQ